MKTIRTLSSIAVALCVILTPMSAEAQSRVGKDSSTRINRYFKDLAIGSAEGLGFAALDQLNNDPVEWGKGWRGYEKRAASNVAQFAIQATTTSLLAAAMNRPLDYQRCHCGNTGERLGWVMMSIVTDPTPTRAHQLAIPRIVGAFAGSFAQASWRPAPAGGRTRMALIDGVSSLLVGGAINAAYEFIHR